MAPSGRGFRGWRWRPRGSGHDRCPAAARGTGEPEGRGGAIRTRRKQEGRRVGATLPTDTYVAFKAHVARTGATGEQVIVAAIERLLRDA